MKKILLLILFISSLFSQINWQNSYKNALNLAKKTKKPLLVFMQRLNPPCRWCEKMKNTTLKDEKIANIINKYFIPVKIVREKKNYPNFLKSKYVPAIFILDFNEKPITKIVGYWDVNDFESDLRYILKKLNSKN
ncbi:thioredoxin family protein [Nitrosophilus kaiyonis]|uniref:thioredoxin family protein n=1 Tax=Nitrosophilus kaiyonis TaxID=2930200 RepID=UPI0024910A4D|nr:DUF255 domain-containing protein [Nitrosophilus kaiyonis]